MKTHVIVIRPSGIIDRFMQFKKFMLIAIRMFYCEENRIIVRTIK